MTDLSTPDFKNPITWKVNTEPSGEARSAQRRPGKAGTAVSNKTEPMVRHSTSAHETHHEDAPDTAKPEPKATVATATRPRRPGKAGTAASDINGTNDLCDRDWSKTLSRQQINILRLIREIAIFRYANNNIWRTSKNSRFKTATIEVLIAFGLVRKFTKQLSDPKAFNREQMAITGKGRDVLTLLEDKS